MSFELIFGVVAVVGIELAIWSNEGWYRTCQEMNDEWFEKMTELAGSVIEELDRMQKEIDELEAKLEDDGR